MTIKNNGHTIQIDYAAGSTLRIGRDKYKLLQFHFHTPSEHTLDGTPTGLEAHFAHINDFGELAVLGVMLVEGEENSFLAPIWANMPDEVGTVTVEGASLNGSDLLPEELNYYAYSGSLTTPPCSEGVGWNVLNDTLEISHEQIETFNHIVHGGNTCPIQALNGRGVLLSDD